MRKHRLFGVVIAVLLGLGAIPQRPGSLRSTIGTTGPHVELASAYLTDVRITSSRPGAPARPDISPPPGAVDPGTMATRSPWLAARTAVDAYLSGRAVENAWAAAYRAAVLHERTVQSTALHRLGPPPPAAPAPRPAPAVAASGGVWARLRQCESGGRYGDDTGNGYYGAYQFSRSTWSSLGLRGLPSAAAPPVQDAAARQLEARGGWGQWPSCARALGLT